MGFTRSFRHYNASRFAPGGFFMITYTATNTKTGRFYIGSARSYNHYVARIGQHHINEAYSDFRKDLQADPLSFEWDYSEDDLDSPDFEEALLAIYCGSPWCYNISPYANGSVPGRAQRGTGWNHSKETRSKMSNSAKRPEAQPAHKKEAQSRAVSETNAKKQPCPCCGKLMNVGNLARHLKSPRNQCHQQVG